VLRSLVTGAFEKRVWVQSCVLDVVPRQAQYLHLRGFFGLVIAGRGRPLVVDLHEANPVLALAQVQIKLQLDMPHARIRQSLLAPTATHMTVTFLGSKLGNCCGFPSFSETRLAQG